MKRFKKSTSITIALLIYVSATAAYFPAAQHCYQ